MPEFTQGQAHTPQNIQSYTTSMSETYTRPEINAAFLLGYLLGTDLLGDSQIESATVEDHDPEERTFTARVNYLDGGFNQPEFYYNLDLTGKVCVMDYLEPEEGDEREWDGDDGLSDIEADAMTLASCGWGTDEDYGYYGGDDW